LLDVQPLLTQAEFRNHVIGYVTDLALRDFWYKEFLPLPAHIKSESISPIVNKTGLLMTHPLIRNIFGQSKSSLDFGNIMDTQKIFIANLSKGHLGEVGTQFLGSMLLTQFQTASLARARQPEAARTPFYLYIDEMHSFMTLSFADILAESRKYGLCLFLTHQYTDQLEENIRTAILGNVGTLICFRIGTNDADILENEFYPVFTKTDLIALPQYSIYLKLLIDGTTSQPFSAVTLPITAQKHGLKEEIIAWSRKTYCLNKDTVNKSIQSRISPDTIGAPQNTLFS